MNRLPGYQPMLEAFHRGFNRELREIIAALPIRKDARILDVGCGDGTYALWMSERIGRKGRVLGIDRSTAYLRLAAARASRHGLSAQLSFRPGAIADLPFNEGTFDLVWCAQSLYSFPDPFEAIREMARVARAGGIVAILEDDSLHEVLLPWPVDLELALRNAEWNAFRREHQNPKKFYIARGLRALFDKAKLRPNHTLWRIFYRESPLGRQESRFLDYYFRTLRQRVTPFLNAVQRRALSTFLTKGSAHYLPRQPHFNMAFLARMTYGIKS